ncbi:MAG: electron transfer flavoprotein subunit beta/FixA family protein [Syntrophales bacterium]
MNIIVCIKEVMDPAIPSVKFNIDTTMKCVVLPQGIPLVINPYDANAVELALRVKTANGGKVTIVTLQAAYSDAIVRHALSMGADDGVVLHDTSFEGLDSFGIAYVLGKAIEKIGNYDLILCGRQAVDWDEGLVGSILAENLQVPLVTIAMDATWAQDKLQVKRVTLDGYQIFETTVPVVLTVSNEVGRPRFPTGFGVISAARKQLTVWKAQDLGVDLPGMEAATSKELIDLSIHEHKRVCEFLSGKSTEETAFKLAAKLREVEAV